VLLRRAVLHWVAVRCGRFVTNESSSSPSFAGLRSPDYQIPFTKLTLGDQGRLPRPTPRVFENSDSRRPDTKTRASRTPNLGMPVRVFLLTRAKPTLSNHRSRANKCASENLKKKQRYLYGDDTSAPLTIVPDRSQVRSLLEERWIVVGDNVDCDVRLAAQFGQRLVVRSSHLQSGIFLENWN